MTSTNWIELATKHGAKFTEHPHEWRASAFVRSRKLPLFTVIAATKEQAAKYFCEYIHCKETRP